MLTMKKTTQIKKRMRKKGLLFYTRYVKMIKNITGGFFHNFFFHSREKCLTLIINNVQ